MVVGVLVSFVLIVYQICAQNYMLRLYIIGYFFDLCYLIKPFIKLKLAYENKLGELVTRTELIRQR